MTYYYRHVYFLLLIALLIVFANLFNSLYISGLTIINIMATILFLCSWLSYGVYVGYKKQRCFLMFTLVYWGLNIGFLILYHFFDYGIASVLAILPVYVSFIPMYALYYFVDFLNITRTGGYILLIIPIIISSILGYIIGSSLYKFKNNHGQNI